MQPANFTPAIEREECGGPCVPPPHAARVTAQRITPTVARVYMQAQFYASPHNTVVTAFVTMTPGSWINTNRARA